MLCAFLRYYFHDASSFHPFIFNLILYLTYVSYKWHIDKSLKIQFLKEFTLFVILTLTFSFLLFIYFHFFIPAFLPSFEFLLYAYTHFFSISFLLFLFIASFQQLDYVKL